MATPAPCACVRDHPQAGLYLEKRGDAVAAVRVVLGVAGRVTGLELGGGRACAGANSSVQSVADERGPAARPAGGRVLLQQTLELWALRVGSCLASWGRRR